MKKLLFVALMALSAMIFTSCNKQQEALDEFRDFTEYLKENSDDFSKQDWEESKQQYEAIVTQLEEYDYSDEELKEIGRLKATCYKAISKGTVNQLEKTINSITNQVEGFIEEFSDNADEDNPGDGE